MPLDDWTWDERKNARNVQIHGLSFETAVLAFADPMAQTVADPCEAEERWRTFGQLRKILILVVHTDPIHEQGRLVTPGRVISARKATPPERRWFEEHLYD